jgi:hypothetical protein
MHCSKKKGFSENIQKAIVSTCFPFIFVLTTCNLKYIIVTPPTTTTTRLGGVTTLQDNNKTKAIEIMGINLKDQSKRKQLPTFNLNQ